MDAGRKRELAAKVRAGERLTRGDGVALYACDDLAWLGGLAHEVRTRKHGDAAYFAVGGEAAGEPATLVYGPGEDVVDRILRVRDDAAGLQVLVPLQDGTVTGADALRTFAVARLLLDDVPHLRASADAHGVQTAQLALQHGADDYAAAELTRDDLVGLLRDAGFRPVERTAGYGTVRAYDGPDPARREEPQPMRL